jgi:hypothetical protein
MAAFAAGSEESGVTALVEMAGFADSLLGRPGFLTAIPAWRR